MLATQNVPNTSWNPRIYFRVHSTLPLVPILRRSLSPMLFNIIFIPAVTSEDMLNTLQNDGFFYVSRSQPHV
jgi:hypothetical protein